MLPPECIRARVFRRETWICLTVLDPPSQRPYRVIFFSIACHEFQALGNLNRVEPDAESRVCIGIVTPHQNALSRSAGTENARIIMHCFQGLLTTSCATIRFLWYRIDLFDVPVFRPIGTTELQSPELARTDLFRREQVSVLGEHGSNGSLKSLGDAKKTVPFLRRAWWRLLGSAIIFASPSTNSLW